MFLYTKENSLEDFKLDINYIAQMAGVLYNGEFWFDGRMNIANELEEVAGLSPKRQTTIFRY